jgi:hypothetical protein
MIKLQFVTAVRQYPDRHGEVIMKKSTVFLLGAGAGAAISLIARASRPLWAYAIGGGMIAFEAACDAAENSREALSESARKIRHTLRKQPQS